jgi:hypothetical protein
MGLPYLDNWLLFTLLFGALLIVTLIMMKQSNSFYTKDVIVRRFSIMELETPASPKELYNLIKGLYDLPPEESRRSIKALRGQLIIDFLFMPLAYGCIFLLCWRIAHKMDLNIGYYVFLAFAFLQIIPWICDIVENIYLLGKISPAVEETSPKKHKAYLWLEVFKWGIALLALVCSISIICYFWLTGNYSSHSFIYLLIFLAEAIAFGLAAKFLLREKKEVVGS